MIPLNKTGNQDGMALIATMFILLILTISGIAAISISNNEAFIARNEQLAASEFYDAETGVNDTRLNYNYWLTDDFLTESQTVAYATFDSLSRDSDGTSVASVAVRCIENNDNGNVTIIFGDKANNQPDTADELPAMTHIATPPAGSGYSAKYFVVRRYGITSTSSSGGAVVQSGVWKIFNNY